MKGFNINFGLSTKTKNLIFVILLAIVVVASSLMIIQTIDKSANEEVAYADVTLRGSGTKADPYQIGTAEELGAFRDIINGLSAVTEKHAILTSDIEFDTATAWTPIGTDSYPFKGTFDGNGYSIKGLTINDLSRAGLFGTITGGNTEAASTIIKNVTLVKNGGIGSIATGEDSGAIVGYAYNDYIKIINCHNYLPINTLATTGGIVGQAGPNTTIEECSNHGDITAVYTYAGAPTKLGGIVGFANGLAPLSGDITRNVTIKNCYNEGNISGEPYSDTYTCRMFGGIVGNLQEYAVVSNCFNLGSVTAVTKFEKIQSLFGYVGDLTGDNYTPATAVTISECYYLDGTGTDEKVPAETGSKNAAWFKTESNFDSTKGWDFNTIFEMGVNYPVIRTSRLIIGGHLVGPGSYESPTTSADSSTPMFNYNIKTNTLVLNKFNYDPIRESDKYEYSPYYGYKVEAAIDYVGTEDFTITIGDLSYIYNMSYTSNTYDWYGIRSTGKLIIQKQGAYSEYSTVLRIGFESSVVSGTVYDGVGQSSYGIYCTKGIEFKGGSIDVRGGEIINDSRYTNECIGIYSKGNIEVAANTLNSKNLNIKFVARGATQAIKFDDDNDTLTSGCSGIASASWTGISENTTNAKVICKNTAYNNETLKTTLWGDLTPYKTIFLCGIPIALMPDSFTGDDAIFNGDPAPVYTYTVKYMNSSPSTAFKAFLDENFYATSDYNPGTSSYGEKTISMYHKTVESFSHFVFGYQDSDMDSAQDFYVENNRTGKLEVKKSLPQYTAPEAVEGLKYTGQAQALVTAGTVSSAGATMKYSTDDGETWSTSAPKGTDAGTYSVWFKIDGGSNYSNLDKTLVSSSIVIAENDKTALNAAITLATEYYNDILTDYATVAGILDGAISTATDAKNNKNLLDSEIEAATETLLAALDSAYAGVVDAKITNIGTVEYTTACKGKIDAAREAYTALTADQKDEVVNLQTLVDSEKAYDCKEKINNIGAVEYTSACHDRITAAEQAYDNLTADQKALITDAELKTLNDASKAYECKDTIYSIGNVELTQECQDRICAATDAYEALTADQKALITDAEYKMLIDAQSAFIAKSEIDCIGDVEYTQTCKDNIDAARACYDTLTQDQKNMITDAEYQKLVDAEKSYECKDKIHTIGEVELTQECKEKIEAARGKYDALTDAQKALITDAEYKTLVDAEKIFECKDKINSIGTVEYTSACYDRIMAAEQAYDNLTTEQKAKITDAEYQKLVDAKNAFNQAAAVYVTSKINAIPTPVKYPTSKDSIDAARNAYDALTGEQKELIDEETYNKLLQAEKDYNKQEDDATRTKVEDKDNGVAVETDGTAGISRDIELRVEVKTEVSSKDGKINIDAIQANLNKTQKISKVYDVKLIQTINGVAKEIQPSDIKAGMKIKIHMEIPEGTKTKGLSVLHIHDDGKTELIENVIIDGNTAIIEVSSLSQFALVETTGHGFCVGWIVFIFGILELLFLALYIILRYRLCKGFITKCKLDSLYPKMNLITFILLAISDALFLFALIALCLHQCALTIVMFILMLLMNCLIRLFFLEDLKMIKLPDFKKPVSKKGQKKQEEDQNRVAKEEAAKNAQEEKDLKQQREYARMSKWGLESAQNVEKIEDENGILACGIIQNRKGKVYMFDPNGYTVAPGDVVEITDIAGGKKAVVVVIGNHMAPKERIVDPFKPINCVLYATNKDAEKEAALKAQQEAEEQARREEEARIAAEEQARKEAEQRAAEEAAKKAEEERLEQERLEAERKAQEEARRREEEEAAKKAEEEARKAEEERLEQERLKAALKAQEEAEAQAALKVSEEPTIETVEAKERAHESLTLKDSFVLAKATTSTHTFTKKYVADYLRTKDNVEVNERENWTSTGLPLADTHYVDGKDGKKCFAYVYETEGSIILLLKMDDDFAQKLQEKHTQINKSAFPKQKNTWYSLIINDTYTKEDVEDILDELIGEPKTDEGMSLKESIALAKATTSSHKFTKAYVCEYLRTKDNIEVNTRDNFTRTGLPLADTHYVIRGDKKECFAYVYETEGSIILLAKMRSDYAEGLKEKHANVNFSAFPKQKDTWYSLIIDDTYSKEEFEKIIDDISK